MTSPTAPTASQFYLALQRAIGRVLDPSVRDALNAFLPILMNKEPVTMADIQQALSDLDAAVSDVASRAAADHSDLQSQIDALKAAGVDTSQLQAVADSIEGNVTKLASIDPVAQAGSDAPAAPADPAAPAAPAAPADPTPAPADPAPADPTAGNPGADPTQP